MSKIWPIPCPKCGKEIKKKLSWFNRGDRVCPHCGLKLGTKDFQKTVVKVEKFLEIAEKAFASKPKP